MCLYSPLAVALRMAYWRACNTVKYAAFGSDERQVAFMRAMYCARAHVRVTGEYISYGM